ncbi:MAG: CinA family protein [Actinomycetota bacterium]|nr:CinA family protein [Actinomycetota bacterium]
MAESLTGGQLSGQLAQRPRASRWYRGAVVAYASDVKHEVLGVRPGPVVSRQAALDMARGVAKLLDATVAMAVTGVGGPEPQDGEPPGTVWVAISADGCDDAVRLDLEGTPDEIVEQTCRHSFEFLAEHLGRAR